MAYLETTLGKVTLPALALWIVLGLVVTLFCSSRRKTVFSLVVFLAFTVYITLYDRIPKGFYDYKLVPFWSYRKAMTTDPGLVWEIFWNIVLFVPIGFLLTGLVKKRWKVPALGLLFSCCIEVTQLVTQRGLFEFDDIFHNTLGAVLGMLAAMLGAWILRHLRFGEREDRSGRWRKSEG